MLSKLTYREVVRKLDGYRKQDEQDRRENPTAIPIGWRIPIANMVESVVRKNKERFYKGLAEETMEYLVKKGLLVHYAGDYTFPTTEPLPTEDTIQSHAIKALKALSGRRED